MMTFLIMILCVHRVKADVETDIMVGVVVTLNVEEGTNAAETFKQHVQMSTNNLNPSHVTHVMMFQTIRRNVDHVRADVVVGAPIIINVSVKVNAEGMDSVAKIFR